MFVFFKGNMCTNIATGKSKLVLVNCLLIFSDIFNGKNIFYIHGGLCKC